VHADCETAYTLISSELDRLAHLGEGRREREGQQVGGMCVGGGERGDEFAHVRTCSTVCKKSVCPQ